MSKLRVGWIGTGLMGMPMCMHLVRAGYPVTVFNRTRAKTQPLCDEGAVSVASPLEVAQAADVVFTMLTNASDVRQVMLGPGGVFEGLRPGAITVDSTSSEPSLARELFQIGISKGIHCVDAPVSGGDVGAQEGSLAFMAGGNADTIKVLEPLFKCMGKVTHVGPAGAGQICKLANQITVAANLTGLSEGLIYAEKAGLNPNLFLKAVSGGAAGSKVMDIFGAKIVQRDFLPGGFAENMVKDLGTAIKEAQNMGGCFPGLALTQQLFLSLVAHGDGRLGGQAVCLSLQRLNNITSSDTELKMQ
ncbi:hypothetical protein KP509_30G019000 [Ceratopteris richardii]|nr:hypothetical protein KP509_30G019000 [Ceratopteris richardii]